MAVRPRSVPRRRASISPGAVSWQVSRTTPAAIRHSIAKSTCRLILIGDKDDWTRADRCRTLQASGLARPDLVEAVYYPDAVHAFDSNVKDRTVAGSGGKTHRLAYDPVAAPDAEARTRAFFARFMR